MECERCLAPITTSQTHYQYIEGWARVRDRGANQVLGKKWSDRYLCRICADPGHLPGQASLGV